MNLSHRFYGWINSTRFAVGFRRALFVFMLTVMVAWFVQGTWETGLAWLLLLLLQVLADQNQARVYRAGYSRGSTDFPRRAKESASRGLSEDEYLRLEFALLTNDDLIPVPSWYQPALGRVTYDHDRGYAGPRE